MHSQIENGEDLWMTERSCCLCFLFEALQPVLIGGEAEWYDFDRHVAIQFFIAGTVDLAHATFANQDRLQRFEQEAQAAGTLSHPNILAIFDLGMHEGAPYVVSELLEGESFRDLLSHRRPATRKAIDYAIQMAHGLAGRRCDNR